MSQEVHSTSLEEAEMQNPRRSRLMPIVKRVVMAVAVKKGFDMFQEMRRPQKPSLLGRVAKLGMWAAGGGGIFYAFVSGKLQPVVDKMMGKSSSSDSDRWTSPSTASNPSNSPRPVTSTGGSNMGSSTTETPSSFETHSHESETPRV
jgi:hypothetical protein